MTLEFIPHTPRRKMTQPRAAKIFLARNGICVLCNQQIRQGQAWFIEHPESLALGGSDNDVDLWPAHTKCKAKKDAADAALKSERDRIVTAGLDRQPGSLPGKRIKYSRARGVWIDRATGETVEPPHA